MYQILMIFLLIMIAGMCAIAGMTSSSQPPRQSGGYISPRAGPVDMLQQPKFLIMNGYRFQDTLIAPKDDDPHGCPWTDVDPAVRPRVGVFKDKAYVIDGSQLSDAN